MVLKIFIEEITGKSIDVMNFLKASDTFILICVLIWVLVVQQR